MFHGRSGDEKRKTVVPIGGVTAFSTLDCPGDIAAVFYFQGCPFRCPYCHNPEFQKSRASGFSWEELDSFLSRRQGFLETVVFSGGEPLLHLEDLISASRLAMEKGFRVALHTTGYDSQRLSRLIESVPIDWIGIDLKSGEEDYPESCGVSENLFDEVAASIQILVKAGVRHEVRTTIFPFLLQENRLGTLLNTCRKMGIEKTVWQVCSLEGRPQEKIRTFLDAYVEGNQLADMVSVR